MRLPTPLFPVLAAACLLGTAPSSAQSLADADYALAPILTTTGLGVSGHARFNERWSASLDLSLLPLPAIGTSYAGDGVEMSSRVRSAVLLGHYHPKGTSLALGAGLYLGGHSFDFEGTPSSNAGVGNGTYTPAQIETFVGEFTFMDGPALLLEVGTRGEGYATGIGLGVPSGSKVELGATGPVGDAPAFVEDAASEVQNIRDFADAWPVVVYLRFGYYFGI
jgi:hypothetical protein